MKARWRCGLLMALLLAGGASARASDDEAVVRRVAQLLEEISSDPKPDIPQEDLRQAVGILIVPRIVEVRVGLGRKWGDGVLLSRDDKGQWGHPEPFDISGLSVGAEAAHEVTDLVVLFQTRKGIEEYGKDPGRFVIYMGASLARRHGHGHFHRHPTRDEKDFHVYVRHHGFWVGTGMSAERKRSPAFAAEPVPAVADPKKPKPTAAVAAAARKAAEEPFAARAAREAEEGEARGRRMGESPDMARLKAMLTAMSPPPAQVATTATKDASVRTAGGSRPPAPSPAPTGSRPAASPVPARRVRSDGAGPMPGPGS